MTYLIVLGIYFAALAVVGVVSRRSLGMATLALAAGALLAQLWTDSLTPLVAQSGLVVVQPPLASIVAVLLTVVPAVLVMFRSPKALSMLHSVISSLVFAALAVMLTYPAFEKAVVLDEASQTGADQLLGYAPVIITTGIVLGLLEVLLHKKHPHGAHDRKHKK